MSTSHAVNRDVVALLDVKENFVESGTQSLVPVWNVAEVALDPISFRRNVEGESFGAVVNDLRGFVWVAGRTKAGDDKCNVRKLCGLTSLLAGT